MRSKLSEFIPVMALAAAIALAGASCGGNDGQTAAETGTATPSPGAGSGAPAFPLDTSAPPDNDTVPGEVEAAARRLLADELNVGEGAFRLDSLEGVGWSDASLGCPQEGMMYAQVITPGYRLVFDLAGTSHAVHTNSDGSHMVVCRDGR
ncbi:MAG: hypothetical protein F4W95_15340 [Chloroflexi bacterium]|nr:hypothetical protein [Chloroflexota bacterium]MYD49831.1 hypothetical protein [Chloroflexota bacterium]